MTIGIGFHAIDGLIMGSDRQMTTSGSHKYPEKKLFYDVEDERILVLIGGDELGLAKEVWGKLLEHPISDYESCEQALKTVLDGLGRLYTDLPLQLLCGLATKTGVHLWTFRGKGIYPIMEELGIICVGDSSLIRYLTSRLYMFWPSNSGGIPAAVYLLKRAEEFIDGCKGPMDLIVLKPGPSIHVIGADVIDELDKRLLNNQEKAFNALFSLSPPFSI